MFWWLVLIWMLSFESFTCSFDVNVRRNYVEFKVKGYLNSMNFEEVWVGIYMRSYIYAVKGS